MKKILIVEDNELNLKLMNDILVSQGFDVDSARDGQKGLEKTGENRYDLILLDLQMPVVSGYDFLKLYNGKTPVIVVSACAMESEIQKASALGCAAFIPKPIMIAEFLNTVKAHLA